MIAFVVLGYTSCDINLKHINTCMFFLLWYELNFTVAFKNFELTMGLNSYLIKCKIYYIHKVFFTNESVLLHLNKMTLQNANTTISLRWLVL